MKSIAKISVLLMSLCLIFGALAISAFAAEEPNVTVTSLQTQVEVGDIIEVQITNKAFSMQSLKVVLDFDGDLVWLSEMLNDKGEDAENNMFLYKLNSRGKKTPISPFLSSDYGRIDETSQFSVLFMPAEDTDILEGTIVTLYFEALADGVAEFKLTQESVGKDVYNGEDTISVTIGSSAPACEHPEEKLTSEVTAPTCDEPGTETITCECGHSYTEEIPAYHNNNMEYHPFKDALDCANPGNIEYWYCPGCYECFEDAYAQKFINPWYIEITVDCVRPEGIADCATFTCETCGNDNSGYGEHDVLACKGGVCSKCNAEIEGNGCQNLDTPACTDGLCYYCGGFVAGFGHENGAWAPCCDGECSYGCGLLYPATEEHVDADRDDYCDNCWNHLKHDFEYFDPCVGGECTICWAWVDGEHEYSYACDQICTNCHELTRPDATHSMIHVEAKLADCVNDGNIEHWYCAVCGQYWLDAECEVNTNNQEVILPATDHSYEKSIRGAELSAGDCCTAATYATKCDNCDFEDKTKVIEGELNMAVHTSNETYLGEHNDYNHDVMYSCCHNVKETVPHTVDESKTKEFELQPASCCDDGVKQIVKYCVCGYEISNENDVVIPATGMHSSLSKNEATNPDCCNAGHAAYWKCDTVGRDYSDEAGTKKIEDIDAWLAEGGAGYLAPDPENHIGVIVYTYDDDTHSSYYDCCKTPDATDEPHDFNNDAHTCVCGAVEKHVITLNANGGKFPNGAPEYPIRSNYGDTFNAFDAPARDGYNFIGWNTKADGSGDHFDPAEYRFTEDVTVYAQWDAAHSCTHDHYDIAEGTHQSICSCGKAIGNPVSHSYTDGACFCGAKFTGWDGDYYYVEAVLQKTGWTEIEDSWYYLDTETGKRAEGWTRVPYPEFAIEGNTYAPNQEDLEYNPNFKDAKEAWFLFDDDYGIFAYNLTGVLTIGENMSYVVNGMIPWHPGYIEIDPENNDFCYFVGDAENGGNKTAEGLIYATRGIEPGKYYFINWGRVDEIVGVQNIDEVLYYFDEDHKVAMGKGLVKLENGKYIYVRSNGMLAMGQYYLPMGLEIESKMYQIDADGYIIDPAVINGEYSGTGIHNGYYYVDGKITYAGLIEIDGAIYYVKSNGQVATGEYYVTKTNGMEGFEKGDKLYFDEDGKLLKTGIYENEDGSFSYYVDGRIQIGAGVVKLDDGAYIYVKSNGILATGKYWPTKTNDLLKRGEYDWGTDGKYYAD